jgi:hypothetical protein
MVVILEPRRRTKNTGVEAIPAIVKIIDRGRRRGPRKKIPSCKPPVEVECRLSIVVLAWQIDEKSCGALASSDVPSQPPPIPLPLPPTLEPPRPPPLQTADHTLPPPFLWLVPLNHIPQTQTTRGPRSALRHTTPQPRPPQTSQDQEQNQTCSRRRGVQQVMTRSALRRSFSGSCVSTETTWRTRA